MSLQDGFALGPRFRALPHVASRFRIPTKFIPQTHAARWFRSRLVLDGEIAEKPPGLQEFVTNKPSSRNGPIRHYRSWRRTSQPKETTGKRTLPNPDTDREINASFETESIAIRDE